MLLWHSGVVGWVKILKSWYLVLENSIILTASCRGFLIHMSKNRGKQHLALLYLGVSTSLLGLAWLPPVTEEAKLWNPIYLLLSLSPSFDNDILPQELFEQGHCQKEHSGFARFVSEHKRLFKDTLSASSGKDRENAEIKSEWHTMSLRRSWCRITHLHLGRPLSQFISGETGGPTTPNALVPTYTHLTKNWSLNHPSEEFIEPISELGAGLLKNFPKTNNWLHYARVFWHA